LSKENWHRAVPDTYKFLAPQVLVALLTHCRELGVTINGQAFPHLIYHFVLSYSNWETGSICYSESLSEGLQNALWELSGVPLDIGQTACVRQ
jgi:hypothetical protein